MRTLLNIVPDYTADYHRRTLVYIALHFHAKTKMLTRNKSQYFFNRLNIRTSYKFYAQALFLDFVDLWSVVERRVILEAEVSTLRHVQNGKHP